MVLLKTFAKHFLCEMAGPLLLQVLYSFIGIRFACKIHSEQLKLV